MFSLLTCADTNYFPMALALAKNVRLYGDCRLFLYDLGLKDVERAELQANGVTIEKTAFDEGTFKLNSKGNIRTTHKIDCIRHFLRTYSCGVLVLDADALLVENVVADIFPHDREIVVTYRCNRERKPHILINGKINAGVMAFGAGGSDVFFDEWKEMCADGEHTDQSALSALLERHVALDRIDSVQSYGEYEIRILDGNVFNDVTCRTGKIFHFKNAGRQLNKRLGFTSFAVAHRLFPRFITGVVAFNRRHQWFVWRG